MKVEEARKIITDKIAGIDPLKCSEDVFAWRFAAKLLIDRMEKEKPDRVISIIQEVGYVRGIEHAIFARGIKPFDTNGSFFENVRAWHVLQDDFLKRSERGNYGLN